MDRFHPPIFVTSSHEDVDLASSPTVNTSPEVPATSINISRPAFPSISQPRHVKMRITTDVHFDPAASEMTAVFEVPGLKKRDLSIHMCLCPYSRVRQIIITGRSRPVLPQGIYTVQERRFGDFYRTVVVPVNTKVSPCTSVCP